MSGIEKHEFGIAPITCHSFNKDRNGLALSLNDSSVKVYKKSGPKWVEEHTLSQHGQRVTGIDWAPNKNLIVTCSADRSGFVWQLENGTWKQELVIPRINRAATCVKWSPQEDKFALGSGSRLIAVCYYEKENRWWVSKHIKKPIRSTITCLDWHPNNYLLAAGSTDFKCRVFSAYVKEIQAKPQPDVWGPKPSFGALMQEFSNGGGVHNGGWIHSVSFSPDGSRLAWVGHDSSISVVDANNEMALHTVKQSFLPFMGITWITGNSLVAAGYDCNPILFSFDGSKINMKGKLDQPQEKESQQMSAMNRFKNLDKRATAGNESSTDLKTQHQNTITQVSVHTGTKASATKLATSGVDGNLIIWDLKSLEQQVKELSIS